MSALYEDMKTQTLSLQTLELNLSEFHCLSEDVTKNYNNYGGTCFSYIFFLWFVLTEAEKKSRVTAMLERLHAKHNSSRSWQETGKVVRQAMVRLCHSKKGK